MTRRCIAHSLTGLALLGLVVSAGCTPPPARQSSSSPSPEDRRPSLLKTRATPPGPKPGKGSRREEAVAGLELPDLPQRKSGAESVASFNIEWFGLGENKGRSPAQIRSVARVIQHLDAPLIGLQEIRDEAVMDALIKELPGWKYQIGASGRGQRCAVLWDSDRAAIRRPVEWPDINDGVERAKDSLRDPFVTEARVGKFDFLFIVLHTKAMFDEGALKTRREQFRRLRKRLEEHLAKTGDKDVIIVGDYNDFVGSAALRELTDRRGGKFDFVITDARLPKEATSHLAPDGRIDHVTVTSPHVSQEEWTGDVYTWPKPRGKARRAWEENVSDHLPVWATFDASRDRD